MAPKTTASFSLDEATTHLIQELHARTGRPKSQIVRRAVKVLALTEQNGDIADPLKLRLLNSAYDTLQQAYDEEITQEDVQSLKGDVTDRMLAWGSRAHAILEAVYGLKQSDSEE